MHAAGCDLRGRGMLKILPITHKWAWKARLYSKVFRSED